jgi:4a-hydroxytetrahydrobiopterin dehydratase
MLMTDTAVVETLKQLEGWTREDGMLGKTWTFETFPEALLFVNSVGYLAEQQDHHPDIDIRWRKVILRLVTHSEGGITKKDIAMVRAIDGMG